MNSKLTSHQNGESLANTPSHKQKSSDDDDIHKYEISKQLEEIENMHTGLKDLQSMSDMTAMSMIKPIRSK